MAVKSVIKKETAARIPEKGDKETGKWKSNQYPASSINIKWGADTWLRGQP